MEQTSSMCKELCRRQPTLDLMRPIQAKFGVQIEVLSSSSPEGSLLRLAPPHLTHAL